MSRKRKQRAPAAGTPQPKDAPDKKALQDDELGIEIVDDVGMLHSPTAQQPPFDKKATKQVSVAPEVLTPGSSRPETATPDSSPKLEAAPVPPSKPSVAGDTPDVPVTNAAGHTAVHVVEPLHVSPNEEPSADRSVETLGELLQHAREAKGLSLEEVGARTRIALVTLRHLENDRFGELPAETYVKGFLRSYGLFLGLDVSMLLRRYEKLSGRVSTPVIEIWDEVEVRQARLKIWMPGRRTVALVTGVLVVAALAWVFWSQGAVMLGLRPEGELRQIEIELQREALEGESPRSPVTGLDGAELQQETAVVDGEVTAPGETSPQVSRPAKQAPTEDTAPPVPEVSKKPAPQVKPVEGTQPEKPVVIQPPPVKNPLPKKTIKKKPADKKKPLPTPSPEDAAGPPL